MGSENWLLAATMSELPHPLVDRIGWPWTANSRQLPATMPSGAPWPRVSIVTPSYNQAAYLEEAIRSVLLQGYPNLEYIVMDGGSTDGSAEIIERYEPWLSYLRIGPDGGQADALARGFEQASGEILAWLNSDDRYRPGALVRAARFFAERPKVVFGNGDVCYMDADGHQLERIYAVRASYLLTANMGRHGWPQQGCFWRRWAYEEVGGIDDQFRFCMDRDLFLRLARMGPTRRIPGPSLADFRIHDEAKSATLLDVRRAERSCLMDRHGRDALRSRRRLLQAGWWLWRKPASIRARLNRAWGVEW